MRTSTPPPDAHPTPVLHGLGELIAYLPYMFGFHLSDALVAVGCGSRGVAGASRIDVVDDPSAQELLVDRVFDQQTRAAPQWCELVLFGDSASARRLARQVASRLRAHVAPVHHLVVVRDPIGERPARWQLASCRCGRGCRGGWSDVPPPDRVPVVADRVWEGRAPLADRAELEASLRPRPLVSRAVGALDEVAPDAPEYVRALRQVLDLREEAPPVDRLPVPALAGVLTGLLDLDVRDHLVGWLVPHAGGEVEVRADLTVRLRDLGARPWPSAAAVDPVLRGRMRERLRSLVTCAPDELVAAPATLLGYWCWSAGGGALATSALHRALETRPDYRLARLVLQVLERGLRPDDLMHARSDTR